MIPGRAKDLSAEGVFLLIHQHITDRLRKHGKPCLLRQHVAAAEDDPVAEALAFPKSRPAISAFHPAEILLEGEIQLHVARIPNPICHDFLLV